jgi:hypothetical protein
VLQLFPFRGLSDGAHLAHLLGILKEHRKPREPAPVVVVDREGPIGGAVFGLLRAHAERRPTDFELVGVRASDRAVRQPHVYDRVRDELWANLADWIAEGGAIPEDAKLARELHAPEWIGQVTGRLKASPKDDIRKALGRSPDRADAVALSVWQPAAFRATVGGSTHNEQPPEQISRGGAFDPYSALDCWRRS